jgi:Domain of Unknown Function (DUF1080)
MSSPPIRHPDDRQLVAFQLSKLDQRQIALVNKHLKECRECRHRLTRLAAEMEMPLAPVAVPQAAPLRAPRRRPNPLWLVAGGAIALVSLGIAWAMGAFSGRASSDTVANSDLTTHEPEPKTTLPKTTLPKTTLPKTTLPKTTQPPSAGAAGVGSLAHSEPTTIAPTKLSPTPTRAEEGPGARPSIKPLESAVAANAASRSAEPATAKAVAGDVSAAAKASSTNAFFNGTDLSGWEGSIDVWRIEKGSITGSLPALRKQAALLVSRKRYTDFDLIFRARVEGGIGDCAVHFRSQDHPGDPVPVSGPCCAIYGKDAAADHRTGSLVLEPGHHVEKAPSAQHVERFVDPTENHFRIRCQGKHILIEVNGVKMVNGDFPSLPDEGIIAWKVDANRPPRKVTFKIIKFVDLSQAAPSQTAERPSLSDLELLRAEIKFEGAVKKADETLLNHFDPEIAKLKHSSHAKERDLVDAIEHEKELFKTKGLVPWSRPMRKWLLQYGKELREAQHSVGTAFDAAIDRAEKSHNDRLKESLLTEAAQILVPREVASWEFGERRHLVRRTFYSDGTFTEGEPKSGETLVAASSRFWSPPVDDMLVIEFPDSKDATVTNQQGFEVAADGKMLIAQNNKGQKEIWRRVEDAGDKEDAQQ